MLLLLAQLEFFARGTSTRPPHFWWKKHLEILFSSFWKSKYIRIYWKTCKSKINSFLFVCLNSWISVRVDTYCDLTKLKLFFRKIRKQLSVAKFAGRETLNLFSLPPPLQVTSLVIFIIIQESKKRGNYYCCTVFFSLMQAFHALQ